MTSGFAESCLSVSIAPKLRHNRSRNPVSSCIGNMCLEFMILLNDGSGNSSKIDAVSAGFMRISRILIWQKSIDLLQLYAFAAVELIVVAVAIH